MFAWRGSAILAELARNLPDSARELEALAVDWEPLLTQPWHTAAKSPIWGNLSSRFGALHKISIDFGVMEKAAQVLLVEMDCDWKDVGSWTSLADTRPADAAGNVTTAPRVLHMDARGNITVSESDHLIVALGVTDLVIVHSPDATLVCRKEDVEKLKELVKLREQNFGTTYE